MDRDSKIVLETERLIFRPHIPADLEPWCAMETDAEVRRYVGGRPRTRGEAETRFKECALQPAEGRLGVWAAILKSENKYIGRCGVYPHFGFDHKAVAGEGTLAYYIASPYWGRGLATEAASAFVKFGFEELKLSRIVTAVQTGNEASVHILQKLGFKLLRTEHGPRSFYHFALENPGSV